LWKNIRSQAVWDRKKVQGGTVQTIPKGNTTYYPLYHPIIAVRFMVLPHSRALTSTCT